MSNKIETFNIATKAAGDLITAASVNLIQDGLDQIVSLWGTASAGSARAVKGEVCRASLMNNWILWLKTYASRIGAISVTNNIANVSTEELMKYSKITEVYNATQTIKNWCNRSECNTNESQYHESNSASESQTAECMQGESNNAEG